MHLSPFSLGESGADQLITRRLDPEPPEFDITAMVDLVFMMNIYFLVTFVTVTMGDRANPTKLAFAKDGDKLVSDKTIRDGKELPVVVQIKTAPDAKSATAKFSLNLAKCSSCEHAEYACTCAHGGDEKGHEGHDHKPGEKHDH